MVSFLSNWVKNLSLAIIVVSILEMLLPNNKTKKYVKMVMGLYILFSIISPFIQNSDKFDLENINISSYLDKTTETSTTQVNQDSMDKRLKEIYIEELETDITKKVEEKGYVVNSCEVDAYISEDNNDTGIKKITLKLDKKNIDETNKSSDEETLENKIVSEIQKIQKVDIKIGNTTENNSTKEENKNSNITKNDIESIKEFLISEYGVSKSCLKIN